MRSFALLAPLGLVSCGMEQNPDFQDASFEGKVLKNPSSETVQNDQELDALRSAAKDRKATNAVETIAETQDGDSLASIDTKSDEGVPGGGSESQNDEGDSKPGDNGDNAGAGNDEGAGDGGDEGGQPRYAHTKALQQEASHDVDILWIVDSSLSMSEEQTYLGNNFGSFITALASNNGNFQTAVTTTDACNDSLPSELADRRCPFNYGGDSSTHLRGDFRGDSGRKVLSASDADLITKFQEYADVGTDGSNFEHGLKSAELAVAKSLSGENENLVREGAFLSIIIVSDEEDDGIGLGMYDPYLKFNAVEEGLTNFSYSHLELVNYLNSVKGQGKFSVSAITGTRGQDGNLCTSAHSNPAEEGTAYMNAAEATGGHIQSICDSNWGDSLQEMGADINAQISQVSLDKTALKTTVQVFVDDVKTSDWVFVEGNNSVKFNPTAIPAPGSNIFITYESLEQ